MQWHFEDNVTYFLMKVLMLWKWPSKIHQYSSIWEVNLRCDRFRTSWPVISQSRLLTRWILWFIWGNYLSKGKSHRAVLLGSGQGLATYTQHITSNTISHPVHTQPLHRHASTERCFHRSEERRAKQQLGQRGHNLSGSCAAKPQIHFEVALTESDFQSLS